VRVLQWSREYRKLSALHSIFTRREDGSSVLHTAGYVSSPSVGTAPTLLLPQLLKETELLWAEVFSVHPCPFPLKRRTKTPAFSPLTTFLSR
jgi:hypothetical protein